MADDFNPTLDNIILDIIQISDGYNNAIVEHEISLRPGAVLENMGQTSRKVSFTCLFFGERYEDHKFIISLFEDADPSEEIEFSHPKYGVISGHIQSADIRHDDRTQTAEIGIVFVESSPVVPSETISSDQSVKLNTEQGFSDLVTESTELLESEMLDTLDSSAAGEILNTEVDFSVDLIDQFTTVNGKGRELVKIADSYVKGFQATLTGITTPANSFVASLNYATNLPGAVIRSIALVSEKYTLAFDSIKNTPSRFISSFIDGMATLKQSMPHPKGSDEISTINISLNGSLSTGVTNTQQGAINMFSKSTDNIASGVGMISVGDIFNNDEISRQKQKNLEAAVSFDINGNRNNISTNLPIITVEDIEDTLSFIRTMSQDVIEDSRTLRAIKEMSRDLLNHAIKIKIDFEKIIQKEIFSKTPLHLILSADGSNHNLAERVYNINKIKEPNFTEGTINLYV